MRGYLAQPAQATGRLPTVLVIHENRGLNPHIEDIARRLDQLKGDAACNAGNVFGPGELEQRSEQLRQMGLEP